MRKLKSNQKNIRRFRKHTLKELGNLQDICLFDLHIPILQDSQTFSSYEKKICYVARSYMKMADLARVCSISAANLLSGQQALLGFCSQSAVRLCSRLCLVFIINLLAQHVSRFCHLFNSNLLILSHNINFVYSLFLQLKIGCRLCSNLFAQVWQGY